MAARETMAPCGIRRLGRLSDDPVADNSKRGRRCAAAHRTFRSKLRIGLQCARESIGASVQCCRWTPYRGSMRTACHDKHRIIADSDRARRRYRNFGDASDGYASSTRRRQPGRHRVRSFRMDVSSRTHPDWRSFHRDLRFAVPSARHRPFLQAQPTEARPIRTLANTG